MGSYVTICTEAGGFDAYLARPSLAVAPAVVVLHEVFGVNADLRQTCDDLADQGMFAVCPDLFWRQCPGVDLSVTSDADWKAGLALYTLYDRDLGVLDIVETMKFAARLEGASGRVGVMGTASAA